MRRKKDWFGYGNIKTRVAHMNRQGDACRVGELKPENVIYLQTEEAFIIALKGKYRPCKKCSGEYDHSDGDQ